MIKNDPYENRPVPWRMSRHSLHCVHLCLYLFACMCLYAYLCFIFFFIFVFMFIFFIFFFFIFIIFFFSSSFECVYRKKKKINKKIWRINEIVGRILRTIFQLIVRNEQSNEIFSFFFCFVSSSSPVYFLLLYAFKRIRWVL